VNLGNSITNAIGYGTGAVVADLAIDGLAVNKADYLFAATVAAGQIAASNLIHRGSTQTSSFNFGAACSRLAVSNWIGPANVHSGTVPPVRSGDAFTAPF
jgi:hypothetical protein